MLTYRKFNLFQLNADPQIQETLYLLFRQILNPELTKAEFNAYLFKLCPCEISLVLVYDGADPVGFCFAGFYPFQVNKKQVYVARVALGIVERYRGRNLPLAVFFQGFMRFRLSHPGSEIILMNFVLNPVIYRMTHEYSSNAYPREKCTVPPFLVELKNKILGRMGLEEKFPDSFLVHTPFRVVQSPEQMHRFGRSTNELIREFLRMNPDYNNQTGVLMLVRVNTRNLLHAMGRAFRKRNRKVTRML